jgi:hypothetical protein
VPDRRRSKGKGALPNSTVASARVLGPPKRNAIKAPATWAEEAWSYYDSVGEVRACASWYANGLSRVRLGLALRGRGGEEPQLLAPDDPRNELLEGLAGGETGQSQLLASFGPHLVVPGEAYLVATDDDTLGRTSRVLSSSEIRATETTYEWLNDEGKWVPVPADVLPVHIRRPHARHHNQADSPIRAVLPVLRELSLLSAHVDAAATSRLAGAGLLAIPAEATFAVSEHNADAEDPFLAELMDAMLDPIADRDEPSAVVPTVIRVPGEYLDKIRHITFSTPFDDKAMGLREEAIRRFANGVDMPAAILLGIESANHWTAWQIEESGIKLHLVPMLETIVQGVTVGWWRPLVEALAAEGEEVADADDLIVWYDLSGLIVRPDRSGDAKDLYGLPDAPLKREALLRETGFDSGDEADDDESLRLILTRLVTARPDLAEQILPALFPGAKLLAPVRAAGAPITGEMPEEEAPVEEVAAETPLVTDGADGPTLGAPEQPTAPPDETPPASLPASAVRADAAADAFEGLAFRAIEHAGNRLRNRARSTGDAPMSPAVEVHLHHRPRVEDLDRLLSGAWARVPELAERYGLDPALVERTLDRYVRRILRESTAHDYAAFRTLFDADLGSLTHAG